MMKRNRIRLGLVSDHGGDLLSRDDRAARLQLIDADGYEAGLNGLDRVSRQTAGSDEEPASDGDPFPDDDDQREAAE